MDYDKFILEYLESNDLLDRAESINSFLKDLLAVRSTDTAELGRVWRSLDRLKKENYIHSHQVPALGESGLNLDNSNVVVTLLFAGVQHVKSLRKAETEFALLFRQTDSIEKSNEQNILTGQSTVTTNIAIRAASEATDQLYRRTETYYFIQAGTAIALVILGIITLVNSCNGDKNQKSATEMPQKILIVLKEDTLILTDKTVDTVKVPGHKTLSKKK